MNTKKKETITKNQKPIEYDIHLKYVCKNCGQHHWLSIKEASTKHFKIVCDCDHIFGVKRVNGFQLKFYKKKLKVQNKPEPVKEIKQEHTQVQIVHTISSELLGKATRVLIPYGFTDSEAKSLIANSYKNNPNDDILSLVKQVLGSLRSTNVK